MHMIEVIRVPYARIGTRKLELKVTRPVGLGPFPAMLDLHGGAWTHFDHEVDFVFCEAMARRGFVMCSAEFRTGPDDPWPCFHRDVRAAARFVRHHARALHVDPSTIGAMGGSTGGHMAALLALLPDGPSTEAIDTPQDTSAAINWGALLYPILDVAGRYAMAKEARFDPATAALASTIVGALRQRAIFAGHVVDHPPKLGSPVPRLQRLLELRERGGIGAHAGDVLQVALWLAGKVPLLKAVEYYGLIAAHDGVFPSVAAMHEASPVDIVREGRAQYLPRLLVIQGKDDPNMTGEMTWNFASTYRKAGGTIEVDMLARHGHGFANIPSQKSEAMCDRVAGFARQCTNPGRAAAPTSHVRP